jgi:UV DNA damage repair endonuclease
MLNKGVSYSDAFFDAYETWNDIIPIFHYSEGKNNGRAHKDMADELPENFGKEVLFDVELKSKDIAILDILRRLENDN